MVETTRQALARTCDVVELGLPANAPQEAFAKAFAAARARVDCIFDLGALLRTSHLAPELPVLLWALGNLPRGAGLLSSRRSHLKTSDSILLNCSADRAIFHRTLNDGPFAPLVPFGVDCDRFRPLDPPEREHARLELGIPKDAIALLFAGRLNIQKNLQRAIHLLAAARAVDPRIRLFLAGTEDATRLAAFAVRNEGHRASLEQLAQRLGVADAVHFLGDLPDVQLARCYAACDVFLSLSIHHDENFGYAPIEAMAAGTPALVTDWGGYRDSVIHGVTGFRVPVFFTRHGVRAAWRRALPSLLSVVTHDERRAGMGIQAREHALTHFSMATFASNLRQVVDDAARRKGQPARHGNDAFRFHPMALKLQARNALLNLTRARTGVKFDLTVGPDQYDTYRFFTSPYASTDYSEVEAQPEDRPSLLVEAEILNGHLHSLDPIWPVQHAIPEPHARALLTADGFRTIAQLAHSAAIEPGQLTDSASQLARDGLLDLGRAVAFERETAQTNPGE